MEAPRQLLAARGCRCGCLECMSHAGKIKSRLSSPSSCLHSQPWCLPLVPLGVKGLYLPITVSRAHLSSLTEVLLTSDCFPHRQREAC